MNDLISRQAAIDALRGYLVGKRCPDDGTLTCRLIENEVINKLPSAQLATDTNVGNKAQLYDNGTTFENGGEIKRWSEDIISRQAVMRAIDEALIGKGCSADGTTMAKLINEYVIKKVPSTEPLEDIHREKEQAYYCGYEDGKAAQWDWLKTEIKRMKMTYTICINHDYYTGYMSALSAVEGCIAQLEGDTE